LSLRFEQVFLGRTFDDHSVEEEDQDLVEIEGDDEN